MQNAMPGGMSAQGDAEDEMLRRGEGDVGGEIGQEERGVGCSAVCAEKRSGQQAVEAAIGGPTVYGKHVLSVSRISVSPGLVGDRVDLPGAVVSLVEAHGDEAFGDRGARLARIPGVDSLGSYGRHALMRLKSRM